MSLFRRRSREERERHHIERTLAFGCRGTYLQPEVDLPDDFELPSAALLPLAADPPFTPRKPDVTER